MANLFKVVGISHKDNTSNGKIYHNHYLHCTYERNNMDGVAVKTLSYEGEFDDSIVVGSTVQPYFNMWGNIETVIAVEE